MDTVEFIFQLKKISPQHNSKESGRRLGSNLRPFVLPDRRCVLLFLVILFIILFILFCFGNIYIYMYVLNVISVYFEYFSAYFYFYNLPLLLNSLVLYTRPLYPLRQRSQLSMCNIGSVMLICLFVSSFLVSIYLNVCFPHSIISIMKYNKYYISIIK